MTVRRTIAFTALSALLVVAIAVWFAAARTRRAAVIAVSGLDSQRPGLAAATQAAQQRLVAAEQMQRTATESLASLRAATSNASKEKNPTPTRLRSQSEIIASSPGLERMELERQRAAVNQEYDRFYRQLGLSPQQIAKFRENRLKDAENWMDFRAAARLQDDAGKKAAAELQSKATAEVEKAQAELLGPEGYRRLEEFNRTIAAHNVIVRGLAGAAAIEGQPLSPEQGEALLRATVQSARGTTVRGDIDLVSIDWGALDGIAQRILTPTQFTLFKNVAPPSGFQGRWKYELDAAIQRALDAEQKPSGAKNKPTG